LPVAITELASSSDHDTPRNGGETRTLGSHGNSVKREMLKMQFNNTKS